MATQLPYAVDSLDSVPEGVRDFYTEADGKYVLGVEGVQSDDEVKPLVTAHERAKREIAELRKALKSAPTADDVAELEKLRREAREAKEKATHESGNLDELRTQWKAETEKAVGAIQAKLDEALRREGERDRFLVRSTLAAGISGIAHEDYRDAARLTVAEGHKFAVEWSENGANVVVVDDLHGNQPVTEFLKAWAKTDAAKPFLPSPVKGGSGASGGEPRGGNESWRGKKWSDMTLDEQVAATEVRDYSGKMG